MWLLLFELPLKYQMLKQCLKSILPLTGPVDDTVRIR
jgi:hypothetical protein